MKKKSNMNDLADTVDHCFGKLERLGGLSEANTFLLYAYLMLWNQVGAPVHVIHTHDLERDKDVFVAEFSSN